MNISEITKKENITSVSELIDLEESLWVVGDKESTHNWSFRGQPRDFGTLAPSFQRQFSRKSLGSAEVIESSLIEAFREHYNKLPDKSADMPDIFQLSKGFDLRCLSVMQHYEIPTRLLDWTSNFWIAIYFACASDPGEDAELWYYDRRIFDKQLEKKPELWSFLDYSKQPPPEPFFLNVKDENYIVELDIRITPRMIEQNAHHTVCTNVFSDHAPLLYNLQKDNLKISTTTPLLNRIIISSACKSKALQFLAQHRHITASTIFPDVVGLGRFLRWQFENLRTMLF